MKSNIEELKALRSQQQGQTQTPSKSQQQPVTENSNIPLDPDKALEKLREDAQSIASGLQSAGKNYAAQNILRRTEEFTSEVDRISRFYQIVMNPEVQELAAVIDAGRKINALQGTPMQVSVIVGKPQASNPLGFLGSGDVDFGRFYPASASAQSSQQQLAASTSESNSQDQ